MIQIVFIGNDKKCLSIIKMSIPNIKISLFPFNMEAAEIIEKQKPDIAIIDLDVDRKDWPRLIRKIQNMQKSPSILITGKWYPSERIIKAIKMGVLDYIPKPLTPEDLQKLENTINKSIRIVLADNKSCDNDNSPLLDRVIGCSKQIQTVKELMLSYAKSGAAILLLGESGVGKNLIAETIHKLSKRSSSTFKTIHTAGLPPTLIESELYGTNEGAFTDAKSRPGCFESASKGTLFLDEIGELPLSSQVKLLRILEEKTITRLGGARQISIDVRIISA
ncbi:MAG: sigma-54-dependent Fis family transcriptional regulator, partial [Spirochaetales bacterium]|nr:sigma-54-dependent Fis family transcriptional regulator [Spirochaetales bacterium]